MSYKALLFCPDDKTARVVTQVLSELEFEVERCNEPFAAVKKLMAEHFDAIVVDCDNDQNATLLFKSARNSGSNQTSLSVAVVEGQAGVAKAFRIGANLVLTKPINVEQSKGTLRVARGLLRKTDFSKAAGPSPATARSVVASADFQRPPAPEVAAPRPAITSLPAQPPPSVIAMASASVFEVEKEPEPQPEPAEAALLESMPDPVGPRNRGANPDSTAGPKDYPWQPISNPATEPAASAPRPMAEAAGRAEVDSVKASAMSASFPGIAGTGTERSQEHRSQINRSQSPRSQSRSESFGSTQGAAAAPAPAKDTSQTEVRTTAAQVEPLLFSSFAGLQQEQASGSGGAKKLVAAVLLAAAVGAGYVGWTRIHPESASLAQKQPALAQPSPAQPKVAASANISHSTNSESGGSSATAESQPVEPVQDITLSTADSTPPSTDIASSNPRPAKAAKSSPRVKAKQQASQTSPLTNKTASSLSAPAEAANPNADAKAKDVVVVKNEYFTPVQQAAPAEEPPPPPAPGILDANAGTKTISGIVGAAPTDLPQPAPHALKVSQGVSQGLLVKKVAPVYPPQARKMGIQGAVEILANIGKDGSISSVQLLNGDKILAQAAMDAVKQWKYKAYYLDGQPVDFQTQITVNFKLP